MTRYMIDYLVLLKFEEALLLGFKTYLLADSIESLRKEINGIHYSDDIQIVLKKENNHYCIYGILTYQDVRYVKLIASFNEKLKGDIKAMRSWVIWAMFETSDEEWSREDCKKQLLSNINLRKDIHILSKNNPVAKRKMITGVRKSENLLRESSKAGCFDERIAKYNKVICLPIKDKPLKGGD